MKNLFNEDDFNSLFESAVIDSEGKGPKNNTKTPDVGATKGMQSDFDSMFEDLFSDAAMGDDQSAPVGKQDDTGAAGGSVDPEADDKGNPPTKSEWDSLFEDGGETDDDATEDPAKPSDDDAADDDKTKAPKGTEVSCGKGCKKKGKKLKSDFESLFEDDDEEDDEETAVADPEADPAVDPNAPVDGDDASFAEESFDLMSDLGDFELSGF